MAIVVTDCPRCGAREITFDVGAQLHVDTHHGWQQWHELFCVCRRCHRGTIFVTVQRTNASQSRLFSASGGLVTFDGSLNGYLDVKWHITVKDEKREAPPDHL